MCSVGGGRRYIHTRICIASVVSVNTIVQVRAAESGRGVGHKNRVVMGITRVGTTINAAVTTIAVVAITLHTAATDRSLTMQ